MSDSGTGLGLATESFCCVFVVGEMWLQQFDGDVTMQKGVGGEPHFGHTAAGDAALQRVTPTDRGWLRSLLRHCWKMTLVRTLRAVRECQSIVGESVDVVRHTDGSRTGV